MSKLNYPVKLRYYTKFGKSFTIIDKNGAFSSCCGMPIIAERYNDLWCDEELQAKLQHKPEKKRNYGLNTIPVPNYSNRITQGFDGDITSIQIRNYNEYKDDHDEMFDYSYNERTFNDCNYIVPDFVEDTGWITRTWAESYKGKCSKCHRKISDCLYPGNTNKSEHEQVIHESKGKIRLIKPLTIYSIFKSKDYFIKRNSFKEFLTYNPKTGFLYSVKQQQVKKFNKYNKPILYENKDTKSYFIKNVTYNTQMSSYNNEFVHRCIEERIKYLGFNPFPNDPEFVKKNMSAIFGWLKYPHAVAINLDVTSEIPYRVRKKLLVGVNPFLNHIFKCNAKQIVKNILNTESNDTYINNRLWTAKYLCELFGYDKVISNFELLIKNCGEHLFDPNNKIQPAYRLNVIGEPIDQLAVSTKDIKQLIDQKIGINKLFNMILRLPTIKHNKTFGRTIITHNYIFDIFRMIDRNNEYSNKTYTIPDSKGLDIIEFHDLISKDNRILSNNDQRKFDIPKDILEKFSHTDNDVRFEVVRDVPSLVSYGAELNNCVASHKNYIASGSEIVIGIYNGDGTIKACMDIMFSRQITVSLNDAKENCTQPYHQVGQIKLKFNKPIREDEKLAKVVKQYLIERGVDFSNCYDLQEMQTGFYREQERHVQQFPIIENINAEPIVNQLAGQPI
jgi:hypothetical protein